MLLLNGDSPSPLPLLASASRVSGQPGCAARRSCARPPSAGRAGLGRSERLARSAPAARRGPRCRLALCRRRGRRGRAARGARRPSRPAAVRRARAQRVSGVALAAVDLLAGSYRAAAARWSYPWLSRCRRSCASARVRACQEQQRVVQAELTASRHQRRSAGLAPSIWQRRHWQRRTVKSVGTARAVRAPRRTASIHGHLQNSELSRCKPAALTARADRGISRSTRPPAPALSSLIHIMAGAPYFLTIRTRKRYLARHTFASPLVVSKR